MQLINQIRIKNTILAIITTIVAIFVPSFIFNKYLEGILFFITHVFIRAQFPKQYRFATHSACRLMSAVVFFFGVSFVLPLSCSLLSVIHINYFICWISYTKKLANCFELDCEILKDKINKLCPTLQPLDINKCSEEQLLDRCKLLKMTKHGTEMCINIFVKKMTVEQLSALYCINKRSVIIHKARLKKKLQL